MKSKLNLRLVFIVLFFALENQAQSISLIGNVTDSLKVPLPFANIIAFPNKTNTQLAFAISDEQGRYKLSLNSNETYQVSVSYVGFEKLQFEINIAKNENRNLILKEESNTLREVTLNSKIPVRIKKDTIVFDATFFSTGTERKLKDLLEKLPGVEVENNGGVSVAGKKVNKLLVEGKEFFGGQTKMGIENIPANAVDEIEMLDNYTPVSFLKELQNSDILAMNIKLKKEKKQFTFGDIDVGITPNKNYLVNPKIFYYSPNKTYNFIGDLNDVGVKSFTLNDYLNFEGGMNKMIEDPTSYFKLSRNEMATFLENRDYYASKNRFGAFHLTQQLRSDLDINSYILYSNTDTHTQSISNSQYLSETASINENKRTKGLVNQSFLVGKASVVFKPSVIEDISLNTFVKLSQFASEQKQELNVLNGNNQLFIGNNNDEINLKQDFNWHKRYSKKHSTSLAIFYEYLKGIPNTNWITDIEISQELIPVTKEDEYKLYQNKSFKIHLFNTNFKHYLIVNNSNHLYTTVGYLFNSTLYKTEDYQLLANNLVHNFNNYGFGNNLDYGFSDAYIGLNHKFKSGILTLNSGVFGHFYNWKINQQLTYDNDKLIWLPEIVATLEFSKSEKLNLRYNLKSAVDDGLKYANRYQLQRYNTVYQGNADLENEIFHVARLWYTKFSMYKGIVINSSLGFQKKITSIKNEIRRSGFNQVITPVMTENPETSWSFNANIDKKIGNFRAKIKGNWNLLKYEQFINNTNFVNESFNQGIGLFVVTKHKEWPNLEVGLNHRISKFTAQKVVTKTKYIEPTFKIEYSFLNGFITKVDYTLTKYTYYNSKEQYEMGSASLFYSYKNSPWGFKISGNNMFGVNYKHQNTFSDYIIAENKIYILPRTWMFSLTYKI